jgi:antitoxin HicB
MTLDEYLELPYAVDIRWDADDEIFVARVAEIPECTGHGKTRGEAMEMALDNLRDWIEDALESNQSIPEPAPLESMPSGKWVQRVPRNIHAELVKLASEDRVSLNQLVVSILARELGFRSGLRSNRAVDVRSTLDPSTAHYTVTSSQVAVSKTWLIHDAVAWDVVNRSFVHQLVDKLPHQLKLIPNDRGFDKHDKEKEHKAWN